MKTLLIGADGQLGTDLCKIINKPGLIPLTIKDIDVTDKAKTAEVIRKYSPNLVINTAAYHRVDDCEDNDQLAFQVNALGAKNVALACKEVGAAMVHFSTDYVFDGKKRKPYSEEDKPNPLSAYGISKLAGEYYVSYILEKHFIIRSSGLYGSAGCLGKGGGSFVDNMLKRAKTETEFKVVGDETLAPTYTLDLAKKIVELVNTRKYGLYHITSSGECSWYEFTCKIFELAGIKATVKKVAAAEYPTKARRPAYSVLAHGHLQKLGMDDLRSWQEALRAYLVEKGYLLHEHHRRAA